MVAPKPPVFNPKAADSMTIEEVREIVGLASELMVALDRMGMDKLPKPARDTAAVLGAALGIDAKGEPPNSIEYQHPVLGPTKLDKHGVYQVLSDHKCSVNGCKDTPVCVPRSDRNDPLSLLALCKYHADRLLELHAMPFCTALTLMSKDLILKQKESGEQK